jgi:hypothetical protein
MTATMPTPTSERTGVSCANPAIGMLAPVLSANETPVREGDRGVVHRRTVTRHRRAGAAGDLGRLASTAPRMNRRRCQRDRKPNRM